MAVPFPRRDVHGIDPLATDELMRGDAGNRCVERPLALARHDDVEIELGEQAQALGTRVVVDRTRTKAGQGLGETVEGAQVVITSYAVARIDEVAFRSRPWGAVVLDEAQFVKNHQAKTYQAVRRLTEQGQDVMVVVRNEAGALAQTSRRLRRKVARGADRLEDKLEDLETLYDLVHGEVEDTALDVAATLRSVRRGNGVLGRVRRLIVAGRS